MTTRESNSQALLLGIAYLGFISLGLPDTVIGVAWPSARDTFARQQSDVALIFFGSGAGYFISSFFTGRLLSILKIGLLLAASSALVALSAFAYGTAPVWAMFASASLLHGLGSGAIDAGLNHHIAHHFAARHMNWLHAFYSLGAMFGPLIMTAVIAWHNSWRAGYLIVASILLGLSALFSATHRQWNDPGGSVVTESVETVSLRTIDVLRHPIVWLQVALFFVYTGLEVSLGQWSFTVLTESRQVAKESAGLCVTAYWGSIFIGRILSGFVVNRLGIDRLLRLSTFLSLLSTVLFAWNPSPAFSALGLVLAGFGLASIYPNMMTRTAQRLGKGMAAHAIGFQVSAATLGGAMLPSWMGFLGQRFGLETVGITAIGMALALSMLNESLLRRGSKEP